VAHWGGNCGRPLSNVYWSLTAWTVGPGKKKRSILPVSESQNVSADGDWELETEF